MLNDKTELDMITLPTHVTLSTEDLQQLETTMKELIKGRLDMSQVVLAGEITGKANWLGYFFHSLNEKGLPLDVDSPQVKAVGEEAWQHFRHRSPTEAAQQIYMIAKAKIKEEC